MNKVIITGANGFVGSNIVKYFLLKNIEIVGVDLSKYPVVNENTGLYSYLQADISQPEILLEMLNDSKYDTFIHLAWAGSAGTQRMDYNIQMKNALCTVECLKVAKKLGCNRFIGAGSIMEKEVIAALIDQGGRPGLSYIYGMGKLMAHSLSKSIAADEEIDLVWPLITNAYGVGEFSPRFINTTIRKIIKKEPLLFTSGIQNYDFVYIDDVVEAFYLIAKNGKPFTEYIIGSSNAKPLREFIIEMQQTLAPGVNLQFGDIPFTGTNLALETFNCLETEKDTGFHAKISFKEGVERTMSWIKKIDKK